MRSIACICFIIAVIRTQEFDKDDPIKIFPIKDTYGEFSNMESYQSVLKEI